MCNAKLHGKVTAFADDTALTYSHSNLNVVKAYMKEDLRLLRYWFDKNYLVLSEKTKFMIFGLRNELHFDEHLYNHQLNCPPICNCKSLEQVSVMKYLGLAINSNLSWKSHLDKLRNDLCIALRKFYLLRNICPERVMLYVYHALVGSRLNYGLCCWGGTYPTSLLPITTIQKAFVRIVLKKRRTEHAWPLFIRTKIFPLRHLYILTALKTFYIKNLSPRLHFQFCRYQFRNVNLAVPRPRFTFYRHFYKFIAPRIHNIFLSHNTSSVNTVSQYLNALRKWLFEHESVEFLFQVAQ